MENQLWFINSIFFTLQDGCSRLQNYGIQGATEFESMERTIFQMITETRQILEDQEMNCFTCMLTILSEMTVVH